MTTALRGLAQLLPAQGRWLAWTLLLALAGCADGAAPEANRPQRVASQPLRDAVFDVSVDGIATLEAERIVQLASQVSGRVLRLPVRQGQRVQRGQVVLVLDQAQLQAELASLRAQSLTDKLNAERYERLVQEGAASAIQRDQFRQTALASRQLLAARLADLSFRTVRAPQAGVIGQITLRPGDVLQAGVPFTQLVSNGDLKAQIELPANRSAQIRVGLPVELFNPALAGSPLRTRISAVDPSVVPGTQLLKAQAPLPLDLSPAARANWRHGLRLRADVIVERQRHLAVPFAAVTRLAGQSFVFVVGTRDQLRQRPGRLGTQALRKLPAGTDFALQVPVQLGVLQNNRYAVIAGLAPGQRVITSGLLTLRHGMPVQLH